MAKCTAQSLHMACTDAGEPPRDTDASFLRRGLFRFSRAGEFSALDEPDFRSFIGSFRVCLTASLPYAASAFRGFPNRHPFDSRSKTGGDLEQADFDGQTMRHHRTFGSGQER